LERVAEAVNHLECARRRDQRRGANGGKIFHPRQRFTATPDGLYEGPMNDPLAITSGLATRLAVAACLAALVWLAVWWAL
jgi:hypothetical protein